MLSDYYLLRSLQESLNNVKLSWKDSQEAIFGSIVFDSWMDGHAQMHVEFKAGREFIYFIELWNYASLRYKSFEKKKKCDYDTL